MKNNFNPKMKFFSLHKKKTNKLIIKKNAQSELSQNFLSKKHLYTPYSKLQEIKLVNIGLASTEQIKKWSEKKLPNGKILGQVTNANTLHHKTFKPLKGGLFCERIFGPIKDFECSCGKTKKFTSSIIARFKEDKIFKNDILEEYNNDEQEKERQFCPVCDVEYTWSVIRRYQLGYIQLVTPVTHLWYLKGSPSYLSLLLDMKKKNLESIVYCSENMTLEILNDVVFSKIKDGPFPFVYEKKKEQNKSSKESISLKTTSYLYDSWEKIVNNKNSKKFLPVNVNQSNVNFFNCLKDIKISSYLFFLKKKISSSPNHPIGWRGQKHKIKFIKKNNKPKRLSNWRNLNLKTLNFIIEHLMSFYITKNKEKKYYLSFFSKGTKYINTFNSIPFRILLKLKNFCTFTIFFSLKKKYSFLKISRLSKKLKNFYIFKGITHLKKNEKSFYKIAHKKVHQIMLKIQFEFLKKRIVGKEFMHINKNFSNFSQIFLLNKKHEKIKKQIYANSLNFNYKKNGQGNKNQKRILLNKKKNSLQIDLNFFHEKMIKSILMFRIKKEKLNTLVNSNEIDIENFILLKNGEVPFFIKQKKNILKFIKINTLNPILKQPNFLNSVLTLTRRSLFLNWMKKLSKNRKISCTRNFVETKSYSLKKKKNPYSILTLKKFYSDIFFLKKKKSNNIFKCQSKAKKGAFQNYSLYCLSHRFCWDNKKNWSNFVYFFSGPTKMDDIPIFTYKERIPNSFHRSVSGAKVLQKLLTEFHFQEFKKMDKQNRIFLYELNKQIQKYSSKIYPEVFSNELNLLNSRNAKPLNIGRSPSKIQWKKFCQKRDQLLRRTKFIRKLFRKNSQPESMILSLLPVLPPDLRPILKIQDQIAASDLNRLYQRVLYRNERLKKFLKDSAMNYSYEMKYAQRLLQEAVDNLLQNGKAGGTPERDSRGRLLKSLSEILKGKQGRFRQHLLGKRVDYSGRSVIVVGPQLKIHECGLPKEMALELFLPFLLKRLIHSKMARTVIGAKTILKNHSNFAWEILHEVMQNYPVLLNRAPTLHRLGIQAFQPKLVEGRAILLHPLVCPAFNADFDGDQMAVHIPLTVEARSEAWKLMCSGNHFFSPATGDPLILPTQDMVLGCYYLTTETKENKNSRYSFFENKKKNNRNSKQQKIKLQQISNKSFFKKNKFFLYEYEFVNQKNIHQSFWVKWNGFLESVDDPEVSLEIRIDSFGCWNEIFSKSQSYFDRYGLMVNQYIRTTTGRIFFNEMLSLFS